VIRGVVATIHRIDSTRRHDAGRVNVGLSSEQQREVERLMPMASGLARSLRPKEFDELESEGFLCLT
jgi:hypothetical protein